MKSLIALIVIFSSSLVAQAAPPKNYVLAHQSNGDNIYFHNQNDPNQYDAKVDVYIEHPDGSASYFNAWFRCSEAERLDSDQLNYLYKEEFDNKTSIQYRSKDDIAATLRQICKKLHGKPNVGFGDANHKVKTLRPELLSADFVLSSPQNGNYALKSSNSHGSEGAALAEVGIAAYSLCQAEGGQPWIYKNSAEYKPSLFGSSYIGQAEFFCVKNSNNDFSIQEYFEVPSDDYYFFPSRYGKLALFERSSGHEAVKNKSAAVNAANNYCKNSGKKALISDQTGGYTQYQFICN